MDRKDKDGSDGAFNHSDPFSGVSGGIKTGGMNVLTVWLCILVIWPV